MNPSAPGPEESPAGPNLGAEPNAIDFRPPPPETGSTRADPIVRLVNVAKSFGTLRVLSGVTLTLMPGKTTVVIGPSGTGKSVLLKHVAGLLRPDRGEVWFKFGRVDTMGERDLIAVRRKMGFLFQMGALFDSMDVQDNICFPLVEHTAMEQDQREARCEQVLRMVGLVDVMRKMPADLSGGQRKRVALARAIVLEPELVLYDEPTTGLDPIRSDVINELIIELRDRLRMTNLVVTHDMASAGRIADRMVMLYDGQIIADAEPDRFRLSVNDVVQRFIRGEADREDLARIREGFGPPGNGAGHASGR
ncbi:MAG: ATP-binding cassette domain-containing protein [Planctomycetota bacterium]|nr:ATP-binding cassette domain-containing protein [Planctomycetota bacterium]